MSRGSLRIEAGGFRVDVNTDPSLMPATRRRLPGGGRILIPRVKPFYGTVLDSTIPRQTRPRLWEMEKRSGIEVLSRHLFRPRTEGAMSVYVREFTRACQDLDKTDAGKRARAILFSFLNEDQLRMVERHNYFEITFTHPDFANAYEQRDGKLVAVKFRIHRGYPIMNIELIAFPYSDKWHAFNLCIQPDEPYPTDDIALVQLVALQQDIDEVARTAVWQMAGTPLGRRFKAIFSPLSKPRSEELNFPYIRELAYSGRWKPRRRDEILDYIGRVLDYTQGAR